jgi:hypothetical protein
MTTYTPHKWADVIKAWAEGKPIQYFSIADNSWRECAPGTSWWGNLVIYRIKPEKKSIWLNIYTFNTNKNIRNIVYSYNTKTEADNNAASDRVDCIEYVYKDEE